jgi:replicative DNA helicase
LDHELLEQLKSGQKTIDEVLYPEVHISDISIDNLKVDLMPSGFQSMDDLMFLKKDRGQLVVVAGRPGMGKTSFMLNVAENVAKTMPVYFFSLEMGRDELLTRIMASTINKSSSAIMQGSIPREILSKGIKKLSEIQLYILDRDVYDLHVFLDTVKTLIKRRGNGLVILDYLQLLRTTRGHSTTAEVGEITRSLKLLANELKTPIIIASQLNRQCEMRGVQSGDYRPMMSDLRDSGSIEQDADTVAFVHRQYVYTRAPEDRGRASIIIAKNRHGAIAELDFQYTEHQTRFIDRGVDI